MCARWATAALETARRAAICETPELPALPDHSSSRLCICAIVSFSPSTDSGETSRWNLDLDRDLEVRFGRHGAQHERGSVPPQSPTVSGMSAQREDGLWRKDKWCS